MEALGKLILQLEQRGTGARHEEPASAGQMSETGIDSGSDEGLEPDEDSESEADFEFGESVLGVLRKDSADEVTLLVGADRVQTFPGDRVAGVVVSKRSRMPTNYGELMTFQQMADLVSYLESLKGPS